jgi:pimeloyl-ACP methyl ester carboxylesterase
VKDVATSVDGIPICYEACGTGSPALGFVHGWSCDRSYWSGQLAHFAGRYRVVAIDLAGHGDSGAGREAWTIPAFGADVVAVVEKLDLDEVVLIGHSMGGDVIVEAAVQLPGRVAGLVWVDVYSHLGQPSTPEQVQQFLAPLREDFVTSTRELVRRMAGPNADADLIERIAADMSAAPPEVAIEAAGNSFGNMGAVLARLPELTMPLVAVNPDYRPTDVESLRSHGIETVLVPGVGHWLAQEDPDRFNRVLLGVIEGFDR